MKVYVDEDEKWPDFEIFREKPAYRHTREVELSEEEVSDWEHAQAVIIGIEDKIKKQLRWYD